MSLRRETRNIFIAFPLISYLYLHLLCHTSVIIIISCHRWRRRKIHPTLRCVIRLSFRYLSFFFFIKLGLLEVFELSYSHNGVISYYVIHEHRDVVSSFVQMDARVQLGRNLASLNSPVLLRTCFRLFSTFVPPATVLLYPHDVILTANNACSLYKTSQKYCRTHSHTALLEGSLFMLE